jgi:hypothetical protein
MSSPNKEHLTRKGGGSKEEKKSHIKIKKAGSLLPFRFVCSISRRSEAT